MGRPADWEHCKQCAHYDEDGEYDGCHECVMEKDHFKQKEGKHEEQRRSAEEGHEGL